MTDITNANAANTDAHFVVITTPSTAPVNYTITGGNGVVVDSGTVSNSAPVTFQIAENVGSAIVPTVTGTTSHHIDESELNTVTTAGIVVEADEPVYVNIRQRSRSQGASLTSKGCAALGTEFRVGTMRNRFSPGQAFRNDFFSIMATEDNTVVTIDEIKPGMIFSGRTDTSAITVTLDKWESYTVGIHHPNYTGTADVNDIDGTRVTSDKAVTLVSGTYLGSPTATGARDAGFDQPGPTARAGTEYVIVAGAAALTSALESPQVIATRANTDVFVNGSLTPINATPLQPGDYLYLDNNFSANGTMFIETSEPALVYQTTAGSNSAATPGFSFIPPLSQDVTNFVDNIATVNQIGAATIRVVTTAGSTLTINGQAPTNGPLSIAGTNDWVLYTQPNATGNASVLSTGPIAASLLNFQNPVGASGYFSGFPDFKALIEIVSTEDCLPGLELVAVDPSGSLIQQFEWFLDDGTPSGVPTGVTGASFTPSAPGDYFVRSFLTPTAPCTVEDSDTFTVVNCPVSDVSITKTVPQDPVGPGGVVTFTLEVSNAGPDPAADVSIEDIVPAGYTYLSNSIVGGDVNSDASPAGSGLRWLIDSLAANSSETVTFQATLNASGATLNTATVTSESIDNDLTNNSADADIVPAVPSFTATKSLDSLVSNPDGSFTATFTHTLTNTGNEPLGAVQFTDGLVTSPNDFPAGSTVGAITGGTLTPNPQAWNGTTNTAQLAGSDVIAVGGNGTSIFTVTFTPDNTAPYCNHSNFAVVGTLSGEAVSLLSDDPSTAAVGDCTQVIPELEAAIVVNKVFDSTLDNGDGSFTSTFTVTIGNTGNDVLTNIVFNEDISDFPNATFVNSTIPSSIAVGDQVDVTVDVTYTPNSTGPFVNEVDVVGTGNLSGDIVSGEAEDEVTPPLNSSLEVEKTLTSLVDDGSGNFTAVFAIEVTNTGNEPLSGIAVTDVLTGFPAAGTSADVSGLATNASIPVGQSITNNVTVTFALDGSAPYANTAEVQGVGSLTGDGVNGASTVPVEPAIEPELAVVKSFTGVVDNGGGSFVASFDITVSNVGNEPLSGVTVTDDLSGFPGTPALTGTLSSGVSLAVGASFTDQVTIEFTPNGPGPFENVASVTGTGDFSATGTQANSTAEVTPSLDAAVALTKTLSGVSDNGDGTFTATFILEVENTGNEPVSDVQIVDSLSSIPNTLPSSTIGVSDQNASYNGSSITTVLPSGVTLAVGDTATATVTAQFTPDGSQPYFNTASASAVGSFTGSPESAVSQQVEIDPPLAPALAVTKALDSQVIDNEDGTFTATFAITVENTGNENVSSLQIVDDLSDFALASNIVVASSDLATAYDSATGSLLVGSDTLAIDAVKSLTITLTFTPDSAGPFENQASATSVGDASAEPGVGVSPVLLVPIPLAPELTVTKTLLTNDDSGNGDFTATFLISAENTGNEPLTGVTLTDDTSGLPGAVLSGTLTSGVDLAVGDAVSDTVTVVYTPDGPGPFTNTANATSAGEFTGTPAPGTDGASFVPPFVTEIELSKDVKSVTVGANNLVTSVIDLIVTNVSNQPLNNVQITDDLGALPNDFPAASNATASVLNPDATTNASYTGQQPNISILAANQTLAVNESKTVTIVLEYTAVAGVDEYLNQAIATGFGEFSGGMDTEVSDNPDTPGLDNDPSSNAPPFEPELNITKALDSVVSNNDGSFLATFTLTVENVGSELVENIQITDDISSSFPSGSTLVATSTDFTIAQSGNDLLAGTDSLDVDLGTTPAQEGVGTVTVAVTFTPDNAGPYENQATVSGTGAITLDPDFDVSDDPATGVAEDATLAPFSFNPALTVDKTAGAIVDNGNGTFTVPFTITATNSGDEPLVGLQLTDTLANFTSPNATASSPDLTVAYDPATGDLLAGTDSLGVLESKSVTLAVTFAPTTGGDIANTVDGAANGSFSEVVTADSGAALISPPIITNATLEKSLVSVTDIGGGVFSAVYEISLTNDGNEPLTNIQINENFGDFPAGFTTAVTSSDFDVVANTGDLLAGTDSLLVNAGGSLAVTVNFTPDGNQPYENQAQYEAVGSSSLSVIGELSDDPNTTDAIDPTEVDVVLQPSITIEKALTGNAYVGGTLFEATFSIDIANTGNELLENVTITDDILTGFPSGATIVESLPSNIALAVGAAESYEVVVSYEPDSNTAYTNTAQVNADGAASATALSEQSSADVTPALAPAIGISKSLTSSTHLGGGVYQVVFELAVSNSGNETLQGVQVIDDLSNFPGASNVQVSSADLNAVYNAGANTLLAGTDSLVPTGNGTVTVTFDFVPNGPGPFLNEALVNGTGVASGELTNATSGAVPVVPEFLTAFTLSKTEVGLLDNGNGSFTATYDILATNTGSEDLLDFQITETLANFPATPGVVVTSSTFTTNYNPATGTLLTGTDTLAIGAAQTVTVEVTFTPVDGNAIPNTVTGSGNGLNSSDPANATSNTEDVLPTFTPLLNVEKSIETNVVLANGDIEASYLITVTNSGTEPLSNVQVVDDLTAQASGFPNTVVASVTTVSGVGVNSSYDGVNDIALLAANQSLAVDESAVVRISLVSPPVAGQTTYDNQATASGDGDFSGVGAPPVDSDDPATAAPGDPTVLTPDFFVDLALTKTLVGPVIDNGDGTFVATFDLEVTNVSNEAVTDVLIEDDLSGFPTSSTLTVVANPTLFTVTSGGTGAGVPLAINEAATGQVAVTYTAEDADPVLNKATATGNGTSAGDMVSKMATEPAVTPLTSVLVVDKSLLGSVQDLGDGTFEATYLITATNNSNQVLKSLQLVDTLANFNNPAVQLSSADLAVNYNQATGTLLTGVDTLAIAESKSLEMTVIFTPVDNDPIENIASGSALGDFDDVLATDDSPGVNVLAPVEAELAVTKALVGPVEDIGGGQFRSTFTIGVANTGNEELINLQVTDTLSDFPAGTTAVATSTDFVIAADISSGDLLLGTETLAVGASGTITLVVEFTADANEPYENTATGEARGQVSRVVVTDDSSVVVSDPPLNQTLVVTKTAGIVKDNGDGSFVASFAIGFENTSNEPLNLQLLDDLAGFPAGSSATVTGSTGVSVNLNYDGAADAQLLAANTQLAIGATGQVTIDVTYTPDSNVDYINTVDGQGVGGFSDLPVNQSASDSVTTPLNTGVTLAKELTGEVDNLDGTFDAVFRITVTNTSNQELIDLQITEDLSQFNNAAVTLNSPNLTTAYDAGAGTLLAGTDTLVVDGSEFVDITITYTPNGTGPFTNTASVSGEGALDGEPAAADDADAVTPTLNPSIVLSKVLTDLQEGSGGTFIASFDISVENNGNEPLVNVAVTDDLSDFPQVSASDLSALPTAATLAVGEAVTYPVTVTFTPDDNEPYLNTASVTSAGEFSSGPASSSGDAEAAPVLVPSGSLLKTAGPVVDQGDGSFVVSYLIEIENTGNEILENVQVSDDISTSFPAGSVLNVESVSSNLTEAVIGANLLSGFDALAVDEQASINLTVTFTPDGSQPYLNQAVLTATGQASDGPISENSDDPTTAGSDPTTATPTLAGGISLKKR